MNKPERDFRVYSFQINSYMVFAGFKKIMSIRFFVAAFMSLIAWMPLHLFSQNNSLAFDEKKAIELMKKDGVTDAVIEKWKLQHKLLYPNGQNTNPLNQFHKNTPVVNASGTCTDMGAEAGWSVWKAKVGDNNSGTITMGAAGTPTSPRFLINKNTGVNPCTPGTAPGAPSISYVGPIGFGAGSIQMGEENINGSSGGCSSGCVEQLSFSLKVTKADTNFVYAYAIILENPAGHTLANSPFCEIYMLDQNGDTVKCSHHKYMGDTTGGVSPGFYQAACSNPTTGANDVTYQPWTIYGINLINYIGQTVTVYITNSDCGLGGHFCYSYWDFLCPPVSGSMVPYCLGQQTTIVGPSSIPGVPYTYTWYQNHQVYTGPPSASSQSITPTPQVGDTFSVYVQMTSGCNYYIPFAPQPSSINPDFTYSGHCGKMIFTDNSSVFPVSPSNPIVSWNWQFPGGTPSSSTVQNPDTVFYPNGTYTVTLIATSKAGCTDTIQKVIVINPPPPVAVFTANTPCLGVITSLVDGSIEVVGDTISSWHWNIPGGTPSSSTAQNPLVVYNTAGTHSITLIVVSHYGCKDTLDKTILIHDIPIANFGGTAKGCAPVCNNYLDSSIAVDGTITNWQWTFPGGSPPAATGKNPPQICYRSPGTYGASLVVTTNYGCKDTVSITPLVEVYPWPKAQFCIEPNPASISDPVIHFCDQWSDDVMHWSWNFGDNSSIDTTHNNPVHSYSSTVTSNDFYSYDVCIKVQTKYGCWDTICHPVELIPDYTFYMPNTFTPNADMNNEVFFGKCRGVKEYNIWVFDRWGNEIWSCSFSGKNTDWDKDGQDGMSSFCKWDGKVVGGGWDMGGQKNIRAQEDVYVWKVILTDVFKREHTYIGNVNIVR